MIISICGYMGSGKSHISNLLSKKINYKLFDIDKTISSQIGMAITEIFEKKGEVFFRKNEKEILHTLLQTEENCILSLGGGTPIYYDNIDTINKKSISIYLRTSVRTLCQRLSANKNKRPLIAHIKDEDLAEFIAKHLFERGPFYNKCQVIIDTDHKTPEEIVAEIINHLHLPHHL